MRNRLKETIKFLEFEIDLQIKLIAENNLETKTLENILLFLIDLKDTLKNFNLKENYILQFISELDFIKEHLPIDSKKSQLFTTEEDKYRFKKHILSSLDSLESIHTSSRFNLIFFKQLNFFNDNIVAIGANGSGKTTLSNHLKQYLPKTGTVISAQKVLIIPTFSGISNYENTKNELKNIQNIDKSLKETYSTLNNNSSYSIMKKVGDEFKILLDNLLAERNVIRNEYINKKLRGNESNDVPLTNLDYAIKIWNSLIEHRTLDCNDGINITLKEKETSKEYPAHLMSDGEKVILYLVAHILQAPKSGFIIIDEPEMYLHKTILKKLWDILENKRQDCIFIYLTHDLDFATSRVLSKKVWIKSFNHPKKWEIESIPENDFPESLLYELLGSRKNILFCEGEKGKMDEKIYNIIFPEYTITPVGNCTSVINYTKAFNRLKNVTTQAYGIIDSDHHGIERLSSLQNENLFSFSVSEIESLFFDEEFLLIVAKQLMVDKIVVEEIQKQVIQEFENEIELQVSNYLTAKVNHFFKGTHVSKGNTLDDVKSKYNSFQGKIKIDEWYLSRKEEILKIIKENDYSKIISVYNNKGLKKIANKNFKISNFQELSMKLLQTNENAQKILKRHFPIQLK